MLSSSLREARWSAADRGGGGMLDGTDEGALTASESIWV